MEPTAIDPRDRLRALRQEMNQAVDHSRASLNRALGAAWQIGQLLCAEKPHVRRRMGRGTWPVWLAANFRESQKTAARLMHLARSIHDEQALHALSLRQVYFRLGIPTEPKKRSPTPGLALPNYLHNAQRLLISVRMRLRMRQMNVTDWARLRDDLAPLHRQLNALFAPHSTNNTPP